MTTSTAIGYIDGVQVVTATTNTGVDGEWSAIPNGNVFFFSVFSGEVGPMDVAAIYMADEILNAQDIGMAGGANGAGIALSMIPVPEPSTLILILVGIVGLGVGRRRNRRRWS